MASQPETRYAQGPEGNLAYQVVGDGPTDLVIVPGWFSHVDLLWGGYGFGIYGFGLRGGTIMLCHVLPFEVKARSESL